jgi:hypothetical protein
MNLYTENKRTNGIASKMKYGKSIIMQTENKTKKEQIG